jgi:hypothetical protein
MAMLLGVPVSPGWVDKASARLAAQLGKAGFAEAMLAALAGEKALAADETPVNVLDNNAPQPAVWKGKQEEEDPEEKTPDAPHALIIRTPDGRLTWLQALASRRKGDVAEGIPAAFTGLLMTDGYTGCQHLLTRLADIQQCCANYPDTAVMPIPGSSVLAGGGNRVLDIGIITGLRGRRGAGRGVCSGPGCWRVVWSGRGLAV